MLEAWERRTRLQLVSVCRNGAGGIRRRLRTLRIVKSTDTMAKFEQLALDPLAAHNVFSLAANRNVRQF
jgi:hypothetical protein